MGARGGYDRTPMGLAHVIRKTWRWVVLVAVLLLTYLGVQYWRGFEGIEEWRETVLNVEEVRALLESYEPALDPKDLDEDVSGLAEFQRACELARDLDQRFDVREIMRVPATQEADRIHHREYHAAARPVLEALHRASRGVWPFDVFEDPGPTSDEWESARELARIVELDVSYRLRSDDEVGAAEALLDWVRIVRREVDRVGEARFPRDFPTLLGIGDREWSGDENAGIDLRRLGERGLGRLHRGMRGLDRDADPAVYDAARLAVAAVDMFGELEAVIDWRHRVLGAITGEAPMPYRRASHSVRFSRAWRVQDLTGDAPDPLRPRFQYADIETVVRFRLLRMVVADLLGESAEFVDPFGTEMIRRKHRYGGIEFVSFGPDRTKDTWDDVELVFDW